MLLMIILASFLTVQLQQADHSDKKCVVTQLTVGGLHTDCAGWQALSDEKIIMPEPVLKRMKAGDVFYFVWKDGSWVAEIDTDAKGEPFRLPPHIDRYPACVVVGYRDDAVQGLCEQRGSSKGVELLVFPTQPRWRWLPDQPDRPGTRFYYQQLEKCRVVYSENRMQSSLSLTEDRVSAATNCDP